MWFTELLIELARLIFLARLISKLSVGELRWELATLVRGRGLSEQESWLTSLRLLSRNLCTSSKLESSDICIIGLRPWNTLPSSNWLKLCTCVSSYSPRHSRMLRSSEFRFASQFGFYGFTMHLESAKYELSTPLTSGTLSSCSKSWSSDSESSEISYLSSVDRILFCPNTSSLLTRQKFGLARFAAKLDIEENS